MGYDEIYETYLKVSKKHINRDLFNRSTESCDETIEDIKNNKIAIYTAFTGDYDTLKEPEVIDENCDYICFSDNPDLESGLWKIVLMEDSTLDNNRKAKQYKLLPHKYLKDYKYSFWLDGTFKIKGSIREYIYENIKAHSPMLVTELGMKIDARLWQLWKDHLPIVVTLFGMIISLRDLQSQNVSASILVTEFGMLTEVRALQLLNAASPMLAMEFGSVTDISFKLLVKA